MRSSVWPFLVTVYFEIVFISEISLLILEAMPVVLR